MRALIVSSLLTAVLAAPAAAQGAGQVRPPAPPPRPAQPQSSEARMAVAVLAPAPGRPTRGVVRFSAAGNGVQVVAEVTGLTPGAHALVAHELGDLTAPDGSRAGGVLAMLGSLDADAKGNARLEATCAGVTLAGARGLLGRAIVVHDRGGDSPALALGLAGVAADSTPPVVQVLAPQSGVRINRNPVNVVVSVTDDVGVAGVTIGGQAAQPDPAAPGRYRAAITATAGEQRVTIEATDLAGNKAQAQVAFAFNDRPPEVQANAVIVVEGKVDDLACTLTVNGQKVDYDKATGAWSARVTADPQNPARVTIVATDEYGNVQTQVRQLR